MKKACIPKKDWLPFEEAREMVRKLYLSREIKNSKDYRLYVSRNQDTRYLPYKPRNIYKDNWISWYDWFGTNKYDFALLKKKKEHTCGTNPKFLPFEEARDFTRKLSIDKGINTLKKWKQYCKSGKKPNNIPAVPHQAYKDNGWISLGDWLGTSNTRGCSRKYHVNEDFFKTWSHNMAYVLGFWWADGCIRNSKGSCVFSITQHKDDKYILEDILSAMESNHPLTITRNCFDIEIGSKKIYDDIVKLGGTRRKSLTIEFPDIPKEYLHDFVRGYFDGDGCIYKGEEYGCGFAYGMNFVCGSKKFIEKLNSILEKELEKYSDGIKIGYSGRIKVIPERMAMINGKNCKFRENYRLTLCVNDTRRMRSFLYQDPNCMKLKRKYEKFLLAGKLRQVGGRKIGSKNVHHVSDNVEKI